MKTFMRSKKYCDQTGLSPETMNRICESNKFSEFGHRTSNAINAPFIIDVEKFEKMWDAGEFREVTGG